MKSKFSMKDVSPMSAVALGVALLGLVLAAANNAVEALFPLWVGVSMASIVLPVVAKKLRLHNLKLGRTAEIAAVFLGGLNYYLVVFATGLPLLLAYLGWVIGGILYYMMK